MNAHDLCDKVCLFCTRLLSLHTFWCTQQHIWEIRRNLEEARAGVKTAEIALRIKEAQCSVSTIVAQRTLHSMEVLASHAAAANPTDPPPAVPTNSVQTAPMSSSAPPSRRPPPPPSKPSASSSASFSLNSTDPKVHTIAAATLNSSATADLESLFSSSTGKVRLNDCCALKRLLRSPSFDIQCCVVWLPYLFFVSENLRKFHPVVLLRVFFQVMLPRTTHRHRSRTLYLTWIPQQPQPLEKVTVFMMVQRNL